MRAAATQAALDGIRRTATDLGPAHRRVVLGICDAVAGLLDRVERVETRQRIARRVEALRVACGADGSNGGAKCTIPAD
jgi:hypothetical protein